MSPVLDKIITIVVGKLITVGLPYVIHVIQDWINSVIQKSKDKKSTEKFENEVTKEQSREERKKHEDNFYNS